MLTETDPFIISEQLFNRNMTTQSWLSSQRGTSVLDPGLDIYFKVIDEGGTVEQAVKAREEWFKNKK